MTNEGLYELTREAVTFLSGKTDIKPAAGLLIDNDLGRVAKEIKVGFEIPFTEVPNFPVIEGHQSRGTFTFGELGGKPVVVVNGQICIADGYTALEVAFPVRIIGGLGAGIMLICDTVSGVNPFVGPGGLMLIEDHINLMGDNPLIGPNDDRLGPRFPVMFYPYSQRLNELARKLSIEESIALHSGVYVAVVNPNLKTKAECRFLRDLGADVIGGSTVSEVIAAVHQGMEVMAISAITDTRLNDDTGTLEIEEYLAAAARAEPLLASLITHVIEEL